jgi:hypothetical protein
VKTKKTNTLLWKKWPVVLNVFMNGFKKATMVAFFVDKFPTMTKIATIVDFLQREKK